MLIMLHQFDIAYVEEEQMQYRYNQHKHSRKTDHETCLVVHMLYLYYIY